MKFILICLILFFFQFSSFAQKKTEQKQYNQSINIDLESADKLPSYPGGDKAWSKFLSKNLKWPSQDDGETRGKVIISFDVEKNGSLDHFKIERSLGKPFDTEVLRVMKLSKKWIPAKQNGKPIKTRYTIPIRFIIYGE